eukprot:TRINITY_DN109797_c0_g1_i1.p1 TRINITY_DN109797_c0_g1~~TRINITY_DN109797_c0_g1_i1.p1  ORF type:complete len:525 (-),score=79.31 TRINITY_DN109797_c0_g1_i1:50-1564(-)
MSTEEVVTSAERLWRVIGGADKGGILVRRDKALNSPEADQRLATGSLVLNLELLGGRLRYQLVNGFGPKEGWVSLTLKEKTLLEPVELSPELLKLNQSKSTASQNQELSLDQLERYTERQAKLAQAGGQEEVNLRSAVEDLLAFAKDRSVRKRVIGFIARLLQQALGNEWDVAIPCLCWPLALTSWASSLQDVEYYPISAVKRLLVLVAGFGGSHIDDLQPAVEHWTTQYGADVICWGPSLVASTDQLNVVLDKLLKVLTPEQPVIIHFCSDGGFASVRNLVRMWHEHVLNGGTQISPHDVIQCVVSDSACLGRGSLGLIRDGYYCDPAHREYEQEVLRSGQDPSLEAAPYLMEAGLRMLLYYGTCNASFEEPAASYCRAMMSYKTWKCQCLEPAGLQHTLLPTIEDIFLGIPILIITSKTDAIVQVALSMFMADCFRKLPGRAQALFKRWPSAGEDLLGEDGLGVHTLVFEKTPHCKGFVLNAKEYWNAADRLAQACLGLRGW